MKEIRRAYEPSMRASQRLQQLIEQKGYSFEWLEDAEGRKTELGIFLGQEVCGVYENYEYTTNLRTEGGRALDKILAEFQD